MLYWIKDPCFNKSLITVIFHLIWQILSKLRISELESAIKKICLSHILFKTTQVDLILSSMETRKVSPKQGTVT